MLDWIGTDVVLVVFIMICYLVSRLVGDIIFHKIQFETKIVDQNEVSKPISFTLKNTSQERTDTVLPRRSSVNFDSDISALVVSMRHSGTELVSLLVSLCSKNYDAASAIYFKGRSLGVICRSDLTSETFLRLCSFAPSKIRRGVLSVTKRLKPMPTCLRPPK